MRNVTAIALCLAAFTIFATSCEKEDNQADGGTLTLANSPGAGSAVYVTDYALSAETELSDVIADNIAHGTIGANNTCNFSQWEGSNTGTFNVLVGSPSGSRAESGDVFKYQNGVRFTNGVASLDWSGMTEIEVGINVDIPEWEIVPSDGVLVYSGNTLTPDFLGSIETYTRRDGINLTDNVY